MLVYLVRHAVAVSKEKDISRPLSKDGVLSTQNIANLLAGCIHFLPEQIYHSPKTRALQTAAIFSDTIPGSPAPLVRDGLLPHDNPSIWGDRLSDPDGDVLLVGHLPHLSRLASLLLFGDPEKEIIDFTPGTVLCLEKTGAWRVKWMLSPGVLKEESRL